MDGVQHMNVAKAHLFQPVTGKPRAGAAVITEHDAGVAYRNPGVGLLDQLRSFDGSHAGKDPPRVFLGRADVEPVESSRIVLEPVIECRVINLAQSGRRCHAAACLDPPGAR